MIVVAFRDGKDVVATILFQGKPGIDPEWYRTRAALELARLWNRTARENDSTDMPSNGQGVLKCYESTILIHQPTEIRACPCCGLGEPQGQCHVCGNKNDMPKHADGVCWSCRDPFDGPESVEDEEMGEPLLRGDDLVRAFQVAETHAELDEVLHRAAAENPNIKNFQTGYIRPNVLGLPQYVPTPRDIFRPYADDVYRCPICSDATTDRTAFVKHLQSVHGIVEMCSPVTESGENDVR